MPETNPGTTNLISWWALEENGGQANDSHGTNHLTETSGTIHAVTGKVGYGRDFEAGDTEYLTIVDNASLSFADEDFTIGFWINPESFYSSGTACGVLGKSSFDEYGFNFAGYVGSPKKIRFAVKNYDALTSDLSAGTWYFVVGWHDSVANTVNIQMNNGTPASTSYSGGCYDGTTQFMIGKIINLSSTYFDGILDEVFVYNRVLSADEREWLYNSGNGRSYAEILEAESYAINWW